MVQVVLHEELFTNTVSGAYPTRACRWLTGRICSNKYFEILIGSDGISACFEWKYCVNLSKIPFSFLLFALVIHVAVCTHVVQTLAASAPNSSNGPFGRTSYCIACIEQDLFIYEVKWTLHMSNRRKRAVTIEQLHESNPLNCISLEFSLVLELSDSARLPLCQFSSQRNIELSWWWSP